MKVHSHETIFEYSFLFVNMRVAATFLLPAAVQNASCILQSSWCLLVLCVACWHCQKWKLLFLLQYQL